MENNFIGKATCHLLLFRFLGKYEIIKESLINCRAKLLGLRAAVKSDTQPGLL